jgi:hypothetical protein
MPPPLFISHMPHPLSFSCPIACPPTLPWPFGAPSRGPPPALATPIICGRAAPSQQVTLGLEGLAGLAPDGHAAGAAARLPGAAPAPYAEMGGRHAGVECYSPGDVESMLMQGSVLSPIPPADASGPP